MCAHREKHLERRHSHLLSVCLWVFAVLAAAALSCNLPAQPQAAATAAETTSAPAAVISPSLALPGETLTLTPANPPTDTPTAAITATATLGAPIFTAATNANCRSGPGLNYDVVRVLPAGTSEPIAGKDSTGTWWVIHNGVLCWISYTTGTASGDVSRVPVIPAPPTPLPTATQTATPTLTPTQRLLLPTPVGPIIPLPPMVTSANVTSDAPSCSPCPCRITWRGTITASGALTAHYVWEQRRPTGSWRGITGVRDLTFSGAGTKSTEEFWLQSSIRDTYIVRLHVTSPNEVYSNEVTVQYCP
jgi:hypothetical protein